MIRGDLNCLLMFTGSDADDRDFWGMPTRGAPFLIGDSGNREAWRTESLGEAEPKPTFAFNGSALGTCTCAGAGNRVLGTAMLCDGVMRAFPGNGFGNVVFAAVDV